MTYTDEGCRYGTAYRNRQNMSINRVPAVPFAQIANAALRDRRLSYKARGILAMVLSNVGEWQATAEWIEEQSVPDGRHAIQTALNELSEYGYREVRRERLDDGRIGTVVDWFHEPRITRPTENLTVGKPDRQESGGSIEHYSLEHHDLEHHEQTLVQKPVDPDHRFDQFWQVYPRKTAKGSARRAWMKAMRVVDPITVIAAALRYRDDPNREDTYTAHPATWLNGERWLDDPLPARESRSDRKVSEVQDVIRRAAERDAAFRREIES
jgi:hypothetical protein